MEAVSQCKWGGGGCNVRNREARSLFTAGVHVCLCPCMKGVRFCTDEECIPALIPHGCPCSCMHVCVLHLQIGRTRVPVHAEGGVRAADWTPLQTTSHCATPGCPRYLKTESSKQKG